MKVKVQGQIISLSRATEIRDEYTKAIKMAVRGVKDLPCLYEPDCTLAITARGDGLGLFFRPSKGKQTAIILDTESVRQLKEIVDGYLE